MGHRWITFLILPKPESLWWLVINLYGDLPFCRYLFCYHQPLMKKQLVIFTKNILPMNYISFIGSFSFFGTMFFVAPPKINIACQKINVWKVNFCWGCPIFRREHTLFVLGRVPSTTDFENQLSRDKTLCYVQSHFHFFHNPHITGQDVIPYIPSTTF